MPPAGKSIVADCDVWLRNDVAVSYGVAEERSAAQTPTPTAELADAIATATVPVAPEVTGADVIHSVVLVLLIPVPISATLVQACPATVTELTAGGLLKTLVLFDATATMMWRLELGVPSATLLKDGADPVPARYAWNGTVCDGPLEPNAATMKLVNPASMASAYVLHKGRKDDWPSGGYDLVDKYVLGSGYGAQDWIRLTGKHPCGGEGQRPRR